MPYELAHDTIARQVFDKASTEARTRRKVERYVHEHYQAWQERGAELTQDDIDFINPYLAQINISSEEQAFINEGKAKLLRDRRRRQLLTGLIIGLLSILLVLALWQWRSAQQSSAIAKQEAERAKEAEAEAVDQTKIAKTQTLAAKRSDSLAQLRALEAIAAQQADSLKAIQLGIALSNARRARLTAEQNAQEARALALIAKAQALPRTEIPTALRLVQAAWEMAPVPHPDISRTLSSVFYSQLATEEKPARPVFLQNVLKGDADFGIELCHPDGPKLETEEIDGEITVRTVEGDLVVKLKNPDTRFGIRRVVQSPDGQFFIGMASAGNQIYDDVHLWGRDGQLLRTYEDIRSPIETLQFSPVDSAFMTIGQYNQLQVWSFSSSDPVVAISEPGTLAATFSADGQYIATSNLGGEAKVWNLEGKCLSIMEGIDQGYRLTTVRFSRDGQYIVAGGANRRQLWNWRGALMADLDGHNKSLITAAYFTNSGQEVTSSSLKQINHWQLDGVRLSTFDEYDGEVKTFLPSPNGAYAAMVDLYDELMIMDQFNRTNLAEFTPPTPHARDIQFAPDSKSLLSFGDGAGAAHFTLDGKLIRRFGEKEGWTSAIAFSPDGQLVVIGHESGDVNIWTLDGQLRTTLKGHKYGVNSIHFSPDGQRILTASQDSTAMVWLLNGQLLHSLVGHPAGITKARFSPDGQQIFTLGKNHLRWWTATGEPLQLPRLQEFKFVDAQFSPDSRYLLTGVDRKESLLWNATDQVWAVLPYTGIYTTAIDFSLDSRYLLVAGETGIVHIRPTPEYILHYLQYDAAIPELTPEQCQEYGLE